MRRTAYVVYMTLLWFAAPLHAQTQQKVPAADTTAVVAAVQQFFDGMLQHDTTVIRRVLYPGTRFITLLVDSTGKAPPRSQVDTAFFRTIATRTERFVERMWSPRVLIDGPIATVSTPYDFRLDTQWSHCGIDTFTLMRIAGEWKIVTLAYTVQRTGCPPAPEYK